MEHPGGSQLVRDRRYRADASRAALVADMGVVKEHAQCRNPGLKWKVGATQSSVAEGVDAAISAWVADACNRVSGKETSGEGGKLHAGLARDAKVEELDTWRRSEVSEPFRGNGVTQAVVNGRWAPT